MLDFLNAKIKTNSNIYICEQTMWFCAITSLCVTITNKTKIPA